MYYSLSSHKLASKQITIDGSSTVCDLHISLSAITKLLWMQGAQHPCFQMYRPHSVDLDHRGTPRIRPNSQSRVHGWECEEYS
jgi:hypothetical protein